MVSNFTAPQFVFEKTQYQQLVPFYDKKTSQFREAFLQKITFKY